MELTTADFGPGQAIPKAFTADGADISPALSWRGVPQGTGALALVMEDPDAPVGLWTHWVVYDLPPTLDGLPQDQPRDPALAGGGKQGVNSWSRLGWNGPSPPPGKPHRYVFRLFALSSPLGLEAGATGPKLEGMLQGKVLEEAQLVGIYGR